MSPGSLQCAPAHFRFLDLPPEIRNRIYEHTVVVGKVVFNHSVMNDFPCSRYDEQFLYKRPALSTLRVCKQINAEAESMYLANNLFVLPIRWYEFQPFCDPSVDPLPKLLPNTPYLFSSAGLNLIKNISVAIHTTWVSHINIPEEWAQFEVKPRSHSFTSLSNQERGEVLRIWGFAHVEKSWTVVLDYLCSRRGFRNPIDYVEVDFTHAFCPRDCCRYSGPVPARWVFELAPKMIDVVGLRRGEEFYL